MANIRDNDTNAENLFIVHGVDPYGRKFAGVYTEQDARYLQQADPRLNKVVHKATGVVVNFTR